jgi:hypothetical protein
MRRVALVAILLSFGTAASAAPSAAMPITAEQTIERCKKTPNLCKALIQKERSRVVAAKEACIPKDLSQDALANRVMDVLEDILEEDFGFKEANYSMLAGQLIAFIWPCDVVS